MPIKFKDADSTDKYLKTSSGAGTSGDPFVVEKAISSLTPGSGATQLGKAEDAVHASGDIGVMALAVRKDTAAAVAGADGDYIPLIVDASGRLWVNVGALPAGVLAGMATLPAGSNNIGDVDIASAPTGASSVQMQGPAAHDAAAVGNPVLNGANAVSAEQTAVTANDATKLVATLTGKLIIQPFANPENNVSGVTSSIIDTTPTLVIAAAGAGVRNYITTILVTNSHASVGTYVNITDGSGGTILWTGYAAAGGGGFSVSFPVPIRTTANTALYFASVTNGANVRVSAAGYKGV